MTRGGGRGRADRRADSLPSTAWLNEQPCPLGVYLTELGGSAIGGYDGVAARVDIPSALRRLIVDVEQVTGRTASHIRTGLDLAHGDMLHHLKPQRASDDRVPQSATVSREIPAGSTGSMVT